MSLTFVCRLLGLRDEETSETDNKPVHSSSSNPESDVVKNSENSTPAYTPVDRDAN